MTCNEFVRAIDAYLDDELSVLDILRVRAHLLSCEVCPRVMESEAALHSLLAEDAVRDQVPGPLRERIVRRVAAEEDVEALSRTSVARSRRGPFAALSALLAAAAFVVLLLLVPLLPESRGPRELVPLAAELAAKHLLYSNGRGAALEMRTSEPAEMSRWGERRLGLSLKVPRLDEAGGRLVGGRVSSLADAPAVYLLYEWGGRRVSLFVTRSVPDGRRGGSERAVDGVALTTEALRGVALAWWEEEDEGQFYAAASTGDPSGLREFAILCIRSGQAPKPDRPRAESDELPAPERHDEGDRAPGPASPGQVGWTVGERASMALTKTGSPFHRGGRQFWRRSEECFSNLTHVRPAKV